jgi:hypothetical protein
MVSDALKGAVDWKAFEDAEGNVTQVTVYHPGGTYSFEGTDPDVQPLVEKWKEFKESSRLENTAGSEGCASGKP